MSSVSWPLNYSVTLLKLTNSHVLPATIQLLFFLNYHFPFGFGNESYPMSWNS